jgi:hypothetical protein
MKKNQLNIRQDSNKSDRLIASALYRNINSVLMGYVIDSCMRRNYRHWLLRVFHIRNSIIFRGILVSLLLTFIIVGCKTTPECINKGMVGSKINWGKTIWDDSANVIMTGYSLDHSAQLKEFEVLNDSANTIKYKEPVEVELELFCRTFNFVRKRVMDTQALYEPGKVQNFIQYINPNFNVDIRVAWNPEFNTAGSEKARAAFDSLNVLKEKISK